MKKNSILLGICSLGLMVCATNPLTGKKTLNFVSNSELFLPLCGVWNVSKIKLLPVRLMPEELKL
jgi:hypothetical protein